MRVLRWLSRTFRLGYFFGVEVRVYWIALFILPLIALSEFGRWRISAAEVLTCTVLFTFWLYAVVWSHEMGHILAARRFGIRTPLITLSPLGGLAHLSAPVWSPRVDILISLAGPATHLLWLAVVWPLAALVSGDLPIGLVAFADVMRPGDWVVSPVGFTLGFLRQANLWLMVFNLLPFLPMDGGRVLRAVLGLKLHPNRATLIAARVGQLGAIGFVLYGLFGGFGGRSAWSSILIVIGITNFLSCMREVQAARHGVGPWAGSRPDPWAFDSDAWKRGAEAEGGSGGPGFFARRRARRQERARERDTEDAAALDRELDHVLARVSEVGMANLTKRERAVLKRASKARRERR